MFKYILPNSPIARLYVGCFAVMGAISVTAVVAEMAAVRCFGKR
jgi:hypothetical protein